MKARLVIFAAIVSLLGLGRPTWAQEAKQVDIKRAAPPGAFLAIDIHHSANANYEREYYADILKTIHDERICERVMNIITSHMPHDKLEAAKSRLDEVKTALAPLDLQTLANADEVILAEVMEVPFNHVVVAAKLSSTAAADCERGLVQGMELLSRWSEGKVKVEPSKAKDATISTLVLPKESPFQPAVGRLNDIVLVSTSSDLLRQSVERMQDDSAESKFDDPRLKEALAHLPKADDAVVFFDGQKLFQGLHGIGDFIRGHGGKEEGAIRVARLLDRVFDEIAIVDYQVTVNYTGEGQKRQAGLLKLSDSAKSKLLGKAFLQGDGFDDWQKWVPKDATAYALSSGVNLHELYDGIVKIVREEFPESEEGFSKFADVQEKIGVNLDRDILQSFPGQSVSVSLPVTGDGSARAESVTAIKCTNPDKIRELLGRAVDALNKIPAVQMQQLKLEDASDLNGFQTLNASVFVMAGVRPVIGFQDGWMIIGSSADAAKKLLDVRAGKAESLDGAATLQKLGLEAKGPVYRIRYRDIGAEIREVANMIDKAGAMMPMFMGMVAANAKPDEMKPIQEVMALLPSVAKIIHKFDFYGHSLSVSRKGPLPGTFLQESVTEIRVPKGT
jgi:hypothetical protein